MFLVLNLDTGRYDGWYADQEEAEEMATFHNEEFPGRSVVFEGHLKESESGLLVEHMRQDGLNQDALDGLCYREPPRAEY